jgi:endonuclease/exonuclease/phosphatase family metal-dependent hydrolase
MRLVPKSQLAVALVASLVAGAACAGDVGGNVYSSPGTIGLRLEWGSNFEKSKEIAVSGDGSYRFGVNIRNNTKYRLIGTSAPTGWACRGKQVDRYLTTSAANGTHVYCGTSASTGGVRVGSWNLEWYDSADPVEKKQAIASLINRYSFDVLVLNEVLDTASWDEFIRNHLGNASAWDYRITSAGCSLRQVTMWRKDAVTLESGYDLDASTSGGIIDENSETWNDCGGRRPYIANFAVNNSTLKFTTATIHFKAYTTTSDCQLRKDQVDTFVEWVNWSGMNQKNFIALGDYNDQLPGAGNCSSIDTLAAMETHPDFFFATAQPGYDYAFMMGNGLVTYDTKSFQNTIDHIWASRTLLDRMQATDAYGNGANAAQANMYFTDVGEPDHNPPYISLAK